MIDNLAGVIMWTDQLDAMAAFYRDVLRLPVHSVRPHFVAFDCGGARLSGLAPIRESFRQMFREGANMRFQLRGVQQIRGGLLAVHSVYEYITLVGERRQADPVIATNVYANAGGGWRMIGHHASPVANARAEPPGEKSAPTLLH